MITCVVFDCFGTLVEYRADRLDVSVPDTFALLASHGYRRPYPEFIAEWDAMSRAFEQRSLRTGREFLMGELAREFLGASLSAVHQDLPAAFVESYLEEWRGAVSGHPDAPGTLAKLGRRYRLAVFSNTHHAPLVHQVLKAAGLSDHFSSVATSAEIGWRKPHPEAFKGALEVLGLPPDQALYVGDSYQDDFLGAEAAGLRSVLLDRSDRYPQVTPRVASLSELEPVLATIAGAGSP